MSLEKIFNPKSIAIVGASEEDGKVGNTIAKNILELGYRGEVYLVNSKYDHLFGRKCYRKFSDIEESVDLAILAIPAKFILEEVEKNAKKVKNYVIISAGFSETDIAGQERERELLEVARKKNLNILGPNCLGFIVPKLRLNASFAGGLPEAGNLSFVSQSGALAVAVMDIARKENFKFSNVISIGNKMSVGEAEILNFLATDKDTEVIGMYLESIGNGSEFMRVASSVAKKKPIVILKAGKNPKTQKAISSHTGALAGDDDVTSAILEKTGVLRADNLEEFFDLLSLLKNNQAPKSKETAIVTNAGGVGVLTADSFSGKAIELWNVPEGIKKELRSFLPAEVSVENPIDILGDAKDDRYLKTLEVICSRKEVGSVICILTPQDQTPVDKIAEVIVDFRKKTSKLILTVFLGGERVESAVRKFKGNGVCNFKFPDSAVHALDGSFRWGNFENSRSKPEKKFINARRRNKILKIIEKAKSEGRSALYFSESAEVMEAYGVNVVENFSGAESLNFQRKKIPFNFPVVLKVDSDKVLHKTDKKGLILNIENPEKLQSSISRMKANFPGARLLIQPMAEKGTEIILGIKRDEIFGPVVVCGLGGIYTEIFKMVDYFVPPLNLGQIEDRLVKGKLQFLFSGARSQKKYDLKELARILQGVAQLSIEIPEICEFDINPLVIYNDRKEALALDVKIILESINQ
jgi:acetate---CoA ligase (ADP-forming)